MPKSRNRNEQVKPQVEEQAEIAFAAEQITRLAPDSLPLEEKQALDSETEQGGDEVINPKKRIRSGARGLKQNPKTILMEVAGEASEKQSELADTTDSSSKITLQKEKENEQEHNDTVLLKVIDEQQQPGGNPTIPRSYSTDADQASHQEIGNSEKDNASSESQKHASLAVANQDDTFTYSLFDASGPIYLEIHKGNIYHYFSRAVIAPSIYFNNRAFSDAQSAFPEQLILTNAALSAEEDMVLLSLKLTVREQSALNVEGGIALMDAPLPITAVQTVLVKNKAIQETIINDAALFDGGFITEGLVQIQEEVKLKKVDPSRFSIPKKGALHADNLTKFDRMLGLLAFLKNYAYLSSSRSGIYKSISDHFFLAMQAIEPQFGSTVLSNSNLSEFYAYLFQGDCPEDKILLKWLFDRLRVKENFNDEDLRSFMSAYIATHDESISPERLRSINSALKDNIKRKSALQMIDGLGTKSISVLPIYIFAYLRNYAQQNNILISRRDIITQHSSSFEEYAFALLGYFYGYGSLSNSDERINQLSQAAALATTAKSKPEIKFRTDQHFDRTVINVVFNFVFSKIDLNLKDIKGVVLEDKHFTDNERKAEIAIRKVDLIGSLYEQIRIKPLVADRDTLISLISKAAERISYHSELGFLCQKLLMVPELSAAGSKRLFTHGFIEALKDAYFLKAELIQRLKNPSQNIHPDELQIRISLAKENKEL